MRLLSPSRRGRGLQFAVVVAVSSVRMVKMPRDQVVDMIAMRHCIVPASGAVNMSGVMRTASVLRRALIRVRGSRFHGVVVHVIPVYMVHMSVMQVVCVSIVPDGLVSAIRSMNVTMSCVLRASGGHNSTRNW
jgi:hypothetical protein